MSSEASSGHAKKTPADLKGLHVRAIPILGSTRVEIVGYPTLGWNTGRYLGAIDLPYPLLELPAVEQIIGGLGDELSRYSAHLLKAKRKQA